MPLQDHASTPMHASEAMTDVPMNREAQHAGASPAGALHVETREEGFFHYVAREGRVVLRWVMVIAYSSVFSSSRTFPGQSCCINFCIALGVRPFTGFFICWQICPNIVCKVKCRVFNLRRIS